MRLNLACVGASLLLGSFVGHAGAQCEPQEIDKIIASEGEEGDLYGIWVSLDGDTAMVGAVSDDELANGAGAVYVIERVDGVWTEVDKLTASDGAEADVFGWFISLSGDLAVISSRWDDDLGDNSGSAYVFERQDGVWTEIDKLNASDGGPNDNFGVQVFTDGEVIAVGAPGHPDGGAVYIFELIDDEWTETAKLGPSDGGGFFNFGSPIAIEGDTAFVGATGDVDNGPRFGLGARVREGGW